MRTEHRDRIDAGIRAAARVLAVGLLAACAGAAETTTAGDGDGAIFRSASQSGGAITNAEPLTLVVPVPERIPAGPRGERRARIFLEGLDSPPSAHGLAVYVERPKATWETGVEVPEYVGSVAFGMVPASGWRQGESFALLLDETLDRLGGLAALGDLEVTLVAVPHGDDRETLEAFLADDRPIRIERVRLVIGGG